MVANPARGQLNRDASFTVPYNEKRQQFVLPTFKGVGELGQEIPHDLAPSRTSIYIQPSSIGCNGRFPYPTPLYKNTVPYRTVPCSGGGRSPREDQRQGVVHLRVYSQFRRALLPQDVILRDERLPQSRVREPEPRVQAPVHAMV